MLKSSRSGTAMDYLLATQNPDGSWGDVEAEDIYDRYHPTWTAIDGLREYAWRGERLQSPRLMRLLDQWANKGAEHAAKTGQSTPRLSCESDFLTEQDFIERHLFEASQEEVGATPEELNVFRERESAYRFAHAS
jgi:hypothetical protein